MVTIDFRSTPFSQRRKHISLWENCSTEIHHLFDFQSLELSHDHLCNQVWKILSIFAEHEKTDKWILITLLLGFQIHCFWIRVCFFFLNIFFWIFLGLCLYMTCFTYGCLCQYIFKSFFQNIVLLSAYRYCFFSMPVLICEHGSFWYTYFLQFEK